MTVQEKTVTIPLQRLQDALVDTSMLGKSKHKHDVAFQRTGRDGQVTDQMNCNRCPQIN
jgi:uncharacterized membrane protein YdbT with pleckstrin-like domain